MVDHEASNVPLETMLNHEPKGAFNICSDRHVWH